MCLIGHTGDLQHLKARKIKSSSEVRRRFVKIAHMHCPPVIQADAIICRHFLVPAERRVETCITWSLMSVRKLNTTATDRGEGAAGVIGQFRQ